ncbi:MAG: septation protein A [Acidiferrobacterales bacterium]|jgi:intracellular septation protein
MPKIGQNREKHTMKFLFDFFPLLLFFAAFKLFDIYIATAVAIAATFVQVGAHWFRTHRFETMHLTTLGVLVVFGGMTLVFRDDTFIRWKPTIVYAILAALTLASQLVGNRTLLERMLGSQITLPQQIWARLNLSWGGFFLILGALNLYVAFYYGLDRDPETRLATWVNFKVFGLIGLTVVFVLAQAFVMARYVQEQPEKDGP